MESEDNDAEIRANKGQGRAVLCAIPTHARVLRHALLSYHISLCQHITDSLQPAAAHMQPGDIPNHIHHVHTMTHTFVPHLFPNRLCGATSVVQSPLSLSLALDGRHGYM